MKHRLFEELVDSYLLGQISPENKKLLLDQMEADPDFARHVKESEEAFRVLQLARQRELRRKLKAWDAADMRRSGRKKKTLLILLITILLGFASWCWLTYHYSPANLSRQSFHAVQNHFRISGENQMEAEKWKEGMQAFENEEYENAMIHFLSLPESDDAVLKNYRNWSILLCQLALGGPQSEWVERMKEFLEQAPEPFRSEAERLLKTFKSPLYIFFFHGVLKESVTSVQPKII